MRNSLFLGAAIVALAIPAAAAAQSTGAIDAENADVVVTGSRKSDVDGHKIPTDPKAKAILTQEAISRSVPGQSINDIINQLPAVSFQNNDPFGSAGGTLNIRGFDSSRISQTVDGIPLNDTGNYAIYSNQQLDPELIEQVNVNFGTTDIDSPTASASGSTVNYRSLTPTKDFGARMVGSVGDFSFFRVFGVVNTGEFTSFGTRAWISGSKATNNWFINDYGKIDKQQFNAKLYQPFGSNGDFVSVTGNYNVNRNNFAGSIPLRVDPGRTVGTGTSNGFPTSFDQLPYKVQRCQTDAPQTGVADAPNGCGTSYDFRYNPSNTGNIRINSRFTLADNLVLTVDPSFQYTKANGGGTITGREGAGYTQTASGTRGAITTPLFGYINNNYYFGRDLNGDGDTLDTVTLLAPSQTVTHRYVLLSSLRWDFADHQSIRVGYTHDYGRHRQTGEAGYLQINGKPFDVFPVNNGITAANGRLVQKRDRLSFAILDQVYGEYNGQFGALRFTAGVTGKFFTRELNNFCFTTSASGFVDCLGRGNTADNASYATANPSFAPPQQRNYKYSRVLPSAGLTYSFSDTGSVYFNYSKGIQVPGTDNLYNAFFYARNAAQAKPDAETTDNFDAGIRFQNSRIQAQVGPWYTRFANRLASAYDPDTQTTIYRNLGRVDKYGIDGSIAYTPVRGILLYAFGNYLKSEIKNNVQLGFCNGTTVTSTCPAGSTATTPVFAMTAGKRESGAPVYTAGGRIQASYGPIEIGGTIKRTGRRYVNDQNLPVFVCSVGITNNACNGTTTQIYGAYAPGYTQVDFDARVSMEWAGLNKTTYFQFNVLNAFNQFYVGGFSGGATSQFVTSPTFAQVAYPRTFIGSLNVQF